MSSDPLSAFESSLQGTATVHTTTADEFPAAVEEAVDPPAVGTPLHFEGVSLDGTAVETEFGPTALRDARTGVTPARVGVADYGSVTVAADEHGAELASLYAPRHVAVVAASDVAADMPAAFEALDAEFEAGRDTQVLATGPSATADMGTLVEGVHGPHETHVVVLEDR